MRQNELSPVHISHDCDTIVLELKRMHICIWKQFLVLHVCHMNVSPDTVNVLDGIADFTPHFFLIALHLCHRDGQNH